MFPLLREDYKMILFFIQLISGHFGSQENSISPFADLKAKELFKEVCSRNLLAKVKGNRQFFLCFIIFYTVTVSCWLVVFLVLFD